MTTQTMKLENALFIQSIMSSRPIEKSIFIDKSQENRSFYTDASCKIINIEANKAPASQRQSFSEFDKLISSLEENQETASALGEARKWVADSFYSDLPTLASLRLKAGLSQRKLGEICGLEQSHVSRYESGKHEPSLSIAITIAKALGVSAEVLFEAWSNSRTAKHSEENHD